MSYSLAFEYAHTKPSSTAKFRASIEDFVVEEKIDISEDQAGEHIYIKVQKRGQNTQWIADQLADFCGVRRMDVGFCGLKDRHGVTSQWFSIYYPDADNFTWATFVEKIGKDNISLLEHTRGRKKLRRGEHEANWFEIRLRDIDGDLSSLEARLKKIQESGVPNYFGEQRFGHGASNLERAEQWVAKSRGKLRKKPNNMMVSAARSYLFNLVLSHRVKEQSWCTILEGELIGSDGVATGPLWGRGRSSVSGSLADIEKSVLEPWEHWQNSLEYCGLQQERRNLQLSPSDFTWSFEGADLVLQFSLRPGEYATSVLREIALLENCSIPT